MKTYLYTLILLWCSLVTLAQTATFQGAWFQIQYPSHFIATGSMKSLTADGFDSAVFTSPDKQVEFYVFSPQWEGEANDIKLHLHEKISSSKTQISGATEITWWTIVSLNGSYQRSYIQKTNTAYHTTCVFGIKYRNAKVLDVYKKEYASFKSSLQPFSD
jgi:hypothetical protein